MKNKFVSTIIVSAVFGLLFYLAGSFIAASFDITQWAPAGRAFLGFIWLVITAILCFMVIQNE